MKNKAKTKEQLIKELNGLQKKASELEAKEAQFKQKKERFDLALKASQDGLWDWNIKTGEDYWSPQFKQLIGYQDDEIEASFKKWETMLHPDDRQQVLDILESHTAKHEKFNQEFRFKTKKGDYRWFCSRGQALWDAEGKPIRVVGSIRDITDIKRLELELKESYDDLENKIAKRTSELKVANEKSEKIINKQRQAEDELRKTKGFMDNMIESSLDCIVTADISGYLTRANTYFLQLLGYESEEEVLGKHIADFGPKENKIYESITGEMIKLDEKYFDARKAKYNKFAKEGKIINWQGYFMTKEGKVVPIEQNVSFLYDKKGEPISTFGIARDITERRLADKELNETKFFLENTFRTVLDGIVVVDPQGYITMANDALLDMLGYPQEELVGKNMAVLTPDGEEHVEKTREFLDAFVGNGYAKEFELEWQRKDGRLVDVEINATLVKNQAGNFLSGVGSVRDITSRKLSEETLRKSEEKYFNLIEHANDAIISVDTTGVIVGFNKRAEGMFGYSREEVLGKSSELLVVQENREKQRKELSQLEAAGDAYNRDQNIFEGTGLTKDRKAFNVEFSFYTVETNGEVIATASIRDISQRKLAEQKIIDYQKRLKALTSQLTLSEEKERRHFAEYLHDEIGQYLFASQLQLEQLKAALDSTENATTLDKVLGNIKQVIDNSRSLTFELSSPILYELGLEKALEWLVEHTSKQYSIVVAYEDDRQEKPLDDDMKFFLYQTVRELLTNVAKHAQTQNASVSVKKESSTIQIRVKDNGVGFNPPNKLSSDVQIAGFGLFRINERLEQLGGQMVIESQPNHGTKITIVAPLGVRLA